MANFHIDNDIPVGHAHELSALGHAAVTARDLGLSAAGDQVHLLHAARQGRILVTHNKSDYVLLHEAWRDWSMPFPHAGTLIVKQQKLLVPIMARAIDGFVKSGRFVANEAYEWTARGCWVKL